jgi:hypothetical protein
MLQGDFQRHGRLAEIPNTIPIIAGNDMRFRGISSQAPNQPNGAAAYSLGPLLFGENHPNDLEIQAIDSIQPQPGKGEK